MQIRKTYDFAQSAVFEIIQSRSLSCSSLFTSVGLAHGVCLGQLGVIVTSGSIGANQTTEISCSLRQRKKAWL